jgi:hypothetical protein
MSCDQNLLPENKYDGKTGTLIILNNIQCISGMA